MPELTYRERFEKRLQQQVKETLPRFQERVLPIDWTPRGILTSEGLAVCAMCDLFGVDAVIESGIYNGRSTEMWCRYRGPLPRTPEEEGINWRPRRDVTGVTAIDLSIRAEASRRLGPYEVDLFEGNANDHLPRVLGNHTGTRCGVFIDGPKGEAAIKLAIECMKYPQVQFVGVHDMSRLINGKVHRERQMLEEYEHSMNVEDPDVWFTDAEWFCEDYGHLDADDSHWDREQGTKWTPGYRNEWVEGIPFDGIGREKQTYSEPLGSYGYTIGFLHRDLEGRQCTECACNSTDTDGPTTGAV